MKKRRLVSSVVLGALICGVGVGVAAHAVTQADEQKIPPTSGCIRADKMGGMGELVSFSFNEVANKSEAAVVGTVSSISPPRWNSASGEEWCLQENEQGSPHVVAYQYREVTLDIKKTIFSSPEIDTSSGKIVLTIPGDGKLTDAPGDRGVLAGNGFEMSGYDFAENVLQPGETALLLLDTAPLPTKEGTQVMTSLSFGALGKWQLENGKMKSIVPGRDADAASLENRLISERKAGLKELTADQRRQVTYDPLTSY